MIYSRHSTGCIIVQQNRPVTNNTPLLFDSAWVHSNLGLSSTVYKVKWLFGSGRICSFLLCSLSSFRVTNSSIVDNELLITWGQTETISCPYIFGLPFSLIVNCIVKKMINLTTLPVWVSMLRWSCRLTVLESSSMHFCQALTLCLPTDFDLRNTNNFCNLPNNG